MEQQKINHSSKNLPTITGQQELIPRNFDEVLKSQSPNFQKLSKSDIKSLISCVTKLTIDFLTLNSIGDNIPAIARQFSEDVIETRPDWKIDDIHYFFKFIRQRQDLKECRVMGHRITPLKMMELVVVYEDEKSKVRENTFKIVEEKKEIPPNPELIRKNIKTILSSLPEKKQPERTSIEVDPLIDEAMKSFDFIYATANNSTGTGKRFIEHQGKMVDIDEYVKLYIEKNNTTP